MVVPVLPAAVTPLSRAEVPVPLVTDPAVAAAQGVIPYHAGAAAYYTAQGITPAGPETGASPEQEAAA